MRLTVEREEEGEQARDMVYATMVRKVEGAALGLSLGYEGETTIITSVSRDSLAAEAGVREGDFIVSVNRELTTPDTLPRMLAPEVREIRMGLSRLRERDGKTQVGRSRRNRGVARNVGVGRNGGLGRSCGWAGRSGRSGGAMYEMR